MTDVMTPSQRSRCMSKIRNKDTKPEILLRKRLWAQGLRYRIGYGLIGNPDIVFVSKKVVIFVDGCFWHKCPMHYKQPKTNVNFWREKINKNVERDQKVNQELENRGWTVLRIWEHELTKAPDGAIEKIMKVLGLDPH